MICGSRGSKSNLAKAAGAEPSGQMRNEKLHAVVARSTCPNQKCQKLTVSEHFWKLRCRKKCTPLWREANFQVKMHKAHHVQRTFGSWEVEKMSLWPEAHFQVISVKKTGGFGALLDVRVEKVHAVVAWGTFGSQKWQKLGVATLFWGSYVEIVHTN